MVRIYAPWSIGVGARIGLGPVNIQPVVPSNLCSVSNGDGEGIGGGGTPKAPAASAAGTSIVARPQNATAPSGKITLDHVRHLLAYGQGAEVANVVFNWISSENDERADGWLEDSFYISQCLARKGLPVFDALVTAVNHTNWRAQIIAINALALMGDKRAIPTLLGALDDKNPNTTQCAALALGGLGAIEVVKPLVPALHDGLGRFGNGGDVEDLVEHVLDTIGAQAVEPLIEMLNDPDAKKRLSAAEMLVKYGDTRAVESLIARLKDANPKVREAAADALGCIRDGYGLSADPKKDRFFADPSDLPFSRPSVGHQRSTGIIDTRAVDPLIEALGDKKTRVRVAAAYALGYSYDVRTMEALLKVAFNDRSDEVKLAAAIALQGTGDVRIRPFERYLREIVDMADKASQDDMDQIREVMRRRSETLRKPDSEKS